MRTIYFVLSQTGTVPSRVFQRVTQQPYNHLSLSLDVELRTLCSFARQELDNPFKAGFMWESLETGVFSLFPATQCQIYALEVTNAQYQHLQRLLIHIELTRQRYGYNFLGLVFLWFNIPLFRAHHYVCSQFVAYCLETIGVSLSKSYTLFRPTDISDVAACQLVYEGALHQYRQSLQAEQSLPLIPWSHPA